MKMNKISPRCCTVGATPPSTSAATSSHRSARATWRATARCNPAAPRRPPGAGGVHYEKWRENGELHYEKLGFHGISPTNMVILWDLMGFYQQLGDLT